VLKKEKKKRAWMSLSIIDTSMRRSAFGAIFFDFVDPGLITVTLLLSLISSQQLFC